MRVPIAEWEDVNTMDVVLTFPPLPRGQLTSIRDDTVVASWLGTLLSRTSHKFKCLLMWVTLKKDVINVIYQ